MAQIVVSEFEARRVERMLAELFLGRLRLGESIHVSAEQEGDWLCVRWELATADRSSTYPVEARADLRQQHLRPREAIDLLYDLLAAEFEEHLKGDRAPFSGPEWEAVDFAGRQVFLRGQMHNEIAEQAGTGMLTEDALARSRAMRHEPVADVESGAEPDR